ncbi:hypothetical protein RchiOBHm_Chr1g0341601 [Rosa chinensis]|uniref:Uncharacterized protein n=1 Tax=Rosa chinensis TaxID=74649 RepID=A0A2P6SDT0_ROSCH|nr:hypothetical protein RchiOBHm_Chr1g0341601 [Rosa chinensis]
MDEGFMTSPGLQRRRRRFTLVSYVYLHCSMGFVRAFLVAQWLGKVSLFW